MALKTDRDQLARILEGLPAEALEDIAKYADYWRFKLARQKPNGQKAPKRRKHPAAGIWADRTDITDSGAYSLELRRLIEAKQDGALPH
jgi:hypothetical protein